MNINKIKGKKVITGISLPWFGLSWETKDKERDLARQLIKFLEDRRVLFGISEIETVSECIGSINKIRDFLTTLVINSKEDSQLEQSIQILRKSCRKFMNDISTNRGRMPVHLYNSRFDQNKLFAMLGEMRAVLGKEILALSLTYEIDVDDELFAICEWMLEDNN